MNILGKLIATLGLLLHLYVTTCKSQLSAAEICRTQHSCTDCISAHPECSWCSDAENTTENSRPTVRCSIVSEASCSTKAHLENPRSGFDPAKNADYTNTQVNGKPPIQLKPQQIDLKLRIGEPVVVNITFKKTVEYPLDLYYVMDLSNSMKDDLEVLQNLGGNLVDKIKAKVTNNVNIGFGSFVDKVMMPYASTVEEHLQNPCDKGDCGPVFGFRHQLSISSDKDKFKVAIQGTKISGNIDSPEGGFDALMQIAVCQEEIGWRKDALRVVLYASDASPHIALDGKLAAILEANDQKCHLQQGANTYLKDATVYAKSKELDYPSVGQLKHVFMKHKITTIFAVTKDVYELYKDLDVILESAGYTGLLKEDSSNVVDVISESYDKLKSLIQLSAPTPPENVEMSYRVLCPNSTTWEEDKLQCGNAGSIDDTVVFQFTFKAKGCPKDPTQKDQVTITSAQLNDETVLNFEYLCSCSCSADKVVNSTSCHNKGDYECGTCECDKGYTGRSCQCKKDETEIPFEEQCIQKTSNLFGNTGVSKSVCSGHGFCECGDCICYKGHFEKYCQCISTGCSANQDGVCGGPDKGVCKNCNGNKECKCKGDYFLNQKTQTCTCNKKYCKKDEGAEECSGNGSCDCDKCSCNQIDGKPEFQGLFCEECIHPNCKDKKGVCEDKDFSECAKCVYDAIRVSKSPEDLCGTQCMDKQISYKSFEKLPDCSNSCVNGTYTEECKICEKIELDYSSDVCKTPVEDVACDVTYQIVWDTEQKDYYLYVKKFDQDTDCAKPIDPLMIVFPVTGAILLIGFILLIVWKAYTHFRDKVEYNTFLEDQKKSRWTQGENPLFSKASVRVENPAFIGK